MGVLVFGEYRYTQTLYRQFLILIAFFCKSTKLWLNVESVFRLVVSIFFLLPRYGVRMDVGSSEEVGRKKRLSTNLPEP